MPMKKTISKEAINQLPVAQYEGEVVIVNKPEKIKEAVKDIARYKVIGFDTETRPSFKKGVSYNVSLLQLATADKVYLFRLKKIGFEQSVLELLSNPEIVKIGVAVKDDMAAINKCHPVLPAAFVDLQSYVAQFKIEEKSLQKIYAIVFGKKIRKNERLSNWEAEKLTQKQIVYAATDAWACVQLWNELEKRRKRREAYQRRKARKAAEAQTVFPQDRNQENKD